MRKLILLLPVILLLAGCSLNTSSENNSEDWSVILNQSIETLTESIAILQEENQELKNTLSGAFESMKILQTENEELKKRLGKYAEGVENRNNLGFVYENAKYWFSLDFPITRDWYTLNKEKNNLIFWFKEQKSLFVVTALTKKEREDVQKDFMKPTYLWENDDYVIVYEIAHAEANQTMLDRMREIGQILKTFQTIEKVVWLIETKDNKIDLKNLKRSKYTSASWLSFVLPWDCFDEYIQWWEENLIPHRIENLDFTDDNQRSKRAQCFLPDEKTGKTILALKRQKYSCSDKEKWEYVQIWDNQFILYKIFTMLWDEHRCYRAKFDDQIIDFIFMRWYNDQIIQKILWSINLIDKESWLIKQVYIDPSWNRKLEIDYIQFWLMDEDNFWVPYIINENPKLRTFVVSDNVEIFMQTLTHTPDWSFSWNDEVSFDEFKQKFNDTNQFDEYPQNYNEHLKSVPYEITIKDNVITKIQEVYMS